MQKSNLFVEINHSFIQKPENHQYNKKMDIQTIDIIGKNHFETWTKTRIACRGLIIQNGKILLSYETKNQNQYMIPGGGLEENESEIECCKREIEVGMEPRWVPVEDAIEIFSKHNDYAETDEMRRGMYFREYTALTNILKN